MKKLFAFALIGIMLTGCGSDTEKDSLALSTTEETTEEEAVDYDLYDEKSEDDEGKDRDKDKDNNNDEDIAEEDTEAQDNKADSDAADTNDNTEASQGSPIYNVSNELFVDVSNAVRNNCRSDANADSSKLRSTWSEKASTNEEKTYINTALNLINSYSRLNACRNRIYESGDKASDDDIVLLTSIEDGLSANVEIFLNTDTTSVMDSDFAYSSELDNLELSLNNK